MQKLILFIAVAATLLFSGCASTNLRVPGQVSTVKHGIVTAMEPVRLAERPTGVGGALGSSFGTAIGANVGGSYRDMITGAIIGQVVGMFAGNFAETKISETDGYNVVVKLDNGDDLSIAQKAKDVDTLGIKVGTRVKVLGGATNTSVQPEQGDVTMQERRP